MANVELFEQLADENQLVRMRFSEDHVPYFKGNIAGFPPNVAADFFKWNSAYPVDRSGNPIQLHGEPVIEAPVDRSNRIPIPTDWEDMHHLQLFRLAEKLRPGEKPSDKAEAAMWIRAELERRVNEDTVDG